MDPAVVGEIVALVMFIATLGLVMLGFPVALTLAGSGLMFAFVGAFLGVFDMALLAGLAPRYFGVMVNETLVAVPLFIFMGVMLERSRLAEQLLETMGLLFGRTPGGLGISVALVGALLAASTGVVGATVVTMGLLSLPAMLRAGYDPKLATGVICASGTLGQIIPPSMVLVFLGDMLQGANAAAQMSKGNFAPDPVSVGDLFVGALIPGFILVGLYVLWVAFRAMTDPRSCPPLVTEKQDRRRLGARVAKTMAPPLLLIVAVLGSILSGLATPTESASVGGVGACILAAANRRLTLKVLNEALERTLKVTAMVFVVLLGASVFSLAFRGLGGERMVERLFQALPGGQLMAVVVVMLTMFFLGFFLDTLEIIFIVTPITAPILLAMDGVDPVWLGVMIGVNLQTSFLTPPFGFSLFYLRGVTPRSVATGDIYRGVIPFVALQCVMMAVLYLFPGLATELPRVVFDRAVEVEVPADPGASSGRDDLTPPSTRRNDVFFGGENRNDSLIPGEGFHGDDLLFGGEEEKKPPANERSSGR